MQDLKSIRELRKLTQDDLSGLSGLSQPHLSALERGQFLPTERTRKRIEQLLGSEIDWEHTITGDKAHITAQLVEMLNLRASNAQERISHVKRVLRTIERQLNTIEQ